MRKISIVILSTIVVFLNVGSAEASFFTDWKAKMKSKSTESVSSLSKPAKFSFKSLLNISENQSKQTDNTWPNGKSLSNTGNILKSRTQVPDFSAPMNECINNADGTVTFTQNPNRLNALYLSITRNDGHVRRAWKTILPITTYFDDDKASGYVVSSDDYPNTVIYTEEYNSDLGMYSVRFEKVPIEGYSDPFCSATAVFWYDSNGRFKGIVDSTNCISDYRSHVNDVFLECHPSLNK